MTSRVCNYVIQVHGDTTLLVSAPNSQTRIIDATLLIGLGNSPDKALTILILHSSQASDDFESKGPIIKVACHFLVLVVDLTTSFLDQSSINGTQQWPDYLYLAGRLIIIKP